MGVGAVAWSIGTAAAALLAAPISWRAALLAIACAGIALLIRHPPLRAGLLAAGAAPLWGAAGIAHPAFGAAGLAVWLLAPSGPLPRALPAVLAALAASEGLRLVLAPLPSAAALGAPLLALALPLAGAAKVRGGRGEGVALLAAGLALALGAALAASQPVLVSSDVQRADRWGVLARHEPALLAASALAESALALQPRWHALARFLGEESALSAGWRPEGAALDPDQRVRIARRLERASRGGEARRLLKRGGSDPQFVWWEHLFTRHMGQDPDPPALTGAPPEALLLPGSHTIPLTPGVNELLLHAQSPLSSLTIQPPLRATLDGGPPSRPLQPGPHRIFIEVEGGTSLLLEAR